MKKVQVCAILMIIAAVLAIVTLTEITERTSRFPKEYYLEKIWHMDYGDWGIVPTNQHVLFYITSIKDGKIRGKFAVGDGTGLYIAEFWERSGEIYGTINDGTASVRFVRAAYRTLLGGWVERIDAMAALTFQKDGRIGVSFKPSETVSELVFHENYRSYKIYNLSEIAEIADDIENAEITEVATGYGEETFFFKSTGKSEIGSVLPFAFLINKDRDILACFNHYSIKYYGIDPDDVILRDANNDDRKDVVLTEYYTGKNWGYLFDSYDYIFYQQTNGLFNRIPTSVKREE